MGRTLAHPLGSGSTFTLDLGTKHVLTQTQRFQKSPMGWSDRALGKASPDPAQVKGCSLVRGWWEGGSAGVRICSEAPVSALGGMVPGVCEGLRSPCRCLSLGVLPWLLLCLRASSLLLPTFNLFQFGFPLSLLACSRHPLDAMK